MVPKYIPHLLDLFCTVLFSGASMESERKKNEKVVRLSNSICQDIVYIVSNGNIKTPKSVLFPVVVKSLCNNIPQGAQALICISVVCFSVYLFYECLLTLNYTNMSYNNNTPIVKHIITTYKLICICMFFSLFI
jgi:hypothetical protein